MDKELEQKIEQFNATRDKSRDHWKKSNETGCTYNTPIKFYLGKKYLGCGFVTEFSTGKMRRDCARKLGITYYDGIVFNKNRDMRSFRIKTKNGKMRKDVDFVDPSDFPVTNSISEVNKLSNKDRKANRAAAIKRYHEKNI